MVRSLTETRISLVLVDDHPVYLAGLQQIFRKQTDFEVVGLAENVAQLEDLLGDIQPHVVLMDIESEEPEGFSISF